MKIGEAESNVVLPKLLPDADVPAKIVFGFDFELFSNLSLLTAGCALILVAALECKICCLSWRFCNCRRRDSRDSAKLVEMIKAGGLWQKKKIVKVLDLA